MANQPGMSRVRDAWPIGAVLLGTILRAYKLPRQILVDDEWHSINRLLQADYASIALDFGASDYCIPLTLLYRGVADVLYLNELIMRLPLLLSGIGSIAVLPRLLRRWTGRRAAVLFAFLLAISPLHIYFSRLARPYALTLLLAWIAWAGFYRWWWRAGGRGWKWLYVLAAGIAPWFHLVVLPAVLSPLAAALAALSRRPEGRNLRQLAGVAGGVSGLLLVTIGPPLLAGFGSISRKVGTSRPSAATLTGAAELFAGVTVPWMLVVLGGLAVLGAAVAARRRQGFILLAGWACAWQLAAVVVIGPDHVDVPIALARYSLVALPLLLALTSIGVVALVSRLPIYPRAAPAIAGLLLVVVLAAAGPLPRTLRYPNNWMNQAIFQYDYRHEQMLETMRPEGVSAFYRQLAQLPPGHGLVLEAPWNFSWHYFPFYQSLHRQRTAVGFVSPAGGPVRRGETPFGSRRFRWINAFHVFDHAALVATGVNWVIFHKRLDVEMPAPFPTPAAEVTPWLEYYRRIHGSPDYEDEILAAFRIRPIRFP